MVDGRVSPRNGTCQSDWCHDCGRPFRARHERGAQMYERLGDNRTPDAPANATINHDALGTQLIAGVGVADSPLITAVIEYAQQLSEPYLFNHAMRSWLFAETIGRLRGIDYDHQVVAIGTLLHDIG